MSLRSYLFVPGNRPDRFSKACSSGADAIIIDLEDAVSPDEKSAAREATAAWLSADHPVYIRINACDTEWFEEDIALLQGGGVAGVVLPKTEQREQIISLADKIPKSVRIIPLAESALGIWNVLELALAPQVERLAFGSIDFQLDTGIEGEYEELLYARSRLVLASRIAGVLSPIDGVTTSIENTQLLAEDVRKTKRLGFGGKLCIHPKQVDTVNAEFMPTETELEWAGKIIELINTSGEGVVSFEGKMVDRPVIEKAKKIIEAVSAIKNAKSCQC